MFFTTARLVLAVPRVRSEFDPKFPTIPEFAALTMK